MILQALAFYVFAAITVASAAMVVVSRNPVYSVLFLILAFFNAAGLFLLIGAEFIAMILVIVYVGAVAVLFLFVVMMLDINLVEIREGFLKYLWVGASIGLILLVELAVVFGGWVMSQVDVAGSIRSGRVIEVLTRLVSVHGAPRYLRSDNGPEFVARAVLRWLLTAQIETAFIDPGKPWQNGVATSTRSARIRVSRIKHRMSSRRSRRRPPERGGDPSSGNTYHGAIRRLAIGVKLCR